ncbi:tyrosine-type recombinase/integrase [Evansella sp. AB-P1]|uniref:tyrosine-type recombinase/integrase n=1 Tax=Evansella sp. AB-P1 TaxID=3037653 RepID=UPI00241CE2B1|nr:tyrosine-type recombinase/integrase [Evansella sp. AB-P1]MDG5789036.1 tyrosine-type recombinase/integrase [Evansella sp. AB-P1]
MELVKKVDQFIIILSYDKQPSTLKRYRYDLMQFIRWLESIRGCSSSTSLPSTEELSSYYTYLNTGELYSQNTIRRILSVMKNWFIHEQLEEQVTILSSLIEQTNRKSSSNESIHFFNKHEIKRIFQTLRSYNGLTDKQKQYRHMIKDRNEAIFLLILHYGLTIQELTSLTINHIHFTSNELELTSRKGKERKIDISQDARRKLFEYYMKIPIALRPNRYDSHHFFIAFDYQRGTYRWDIENDCGKRLSDVAIQKMIRQEMKRAGFTGQISCQYLRKSYIINLFLNGVSKEAIQHKLAFETKQPLDRLELVASRLSKEKLAYSLDYKS